MPPAEHPRQLIESIRKEAGGPMPSVEKKEESILRGEQSIESKAERKEETTFADILQYDALRQHHRLLFLESQRRLGKEVDPVEEQLISLHLTYLQYLPQVLQQYIEVADRQAALSRDPLLPPLPPAIRARETAMLEQLRHMQSLLRAYNAVGRGILARVRMDAVLQQEVPQEQYGARQARAQELQAVLQGMRDIPGVPRQAVEAVSEQDTEKAKSQLRTALTELENQLLTILEGKTPEGAQMDTPQTLYVDTLMETFRSLAGRERFVAASNMPYSAKLRMQLALRSDRERIAQEILRATAVSGAYQVDMTELTSIKEMFGRDEYAASVRFGEYEQIPLSPEAKRKRRDIALQFADDRTRGRIAGVTRYFDGIEGEALKVGLWENLEDRWNKDGREASRWVIEKVLDLITKIPSVAREFIGVSGASKAEIMLPLYEVMGYPPGVTDFDKLTTEQQQVVRDRAVSIRDLILRFDRTKIEVVRGTLRVLQVLPRAEQYVGQSVQHEKIATLRQKYPVVTEQNVFSLIAESNVATAYHIVFLQYREQFGGDAPPSGYVGELKTLTDGMQKNMSTHIDFSVAFRELKRNLDPLDRDWILFGAAAGGAYVGWKAGVLPRGRLMPGGNRLLTGLVALRSGTKLVEDWREAQKLREGKREAMANVEMLQEDMRKQLEGDPERFEKLRADEYRHRASGITIRLRNEEEIATLMNALLTGEYVRTGKDAALFAFWGRQLWRGKSVLGPLGLTLLAADITVDSVLDARRKRHILSFVRDASPMILTAFTLHTQLGLQMYTQREGEFEMLDTASETGGAFPEEEREEIRMRLLFSIFQQQCGAVGAEALWEVTGEWQRPADLERLYASEFQSVVYPAYLVILSRDTGMPAEDLLAGRTKADALFPDRVAIPQIRAAMHEALILYIQHVNERVYLEALQQHAALQAELAQKPDDPVLRQRVSDALYAVTVLGQAQALGQPLSSVAAAHAQANQWKTRTELVVTALRDRLGAGDRPYRLGAEGSPIQGLPAAGVDLRSSDAVYALVQDPALRMKIDVSRTPRTRMERSEWSSFGPLYTDAAWRELLPAHIGQQDQKELAHEKILEAVNRLRREQKKPEIEPGAKTIGEFFSGVGDAASPEAQGRKMSPEYARLLLTEEAANVVETGRARARFSRGRWHETHVYEGRPYPIVLFAGQPNNALCSQLSLPNLRGGGEVFAEKNLRAVFFEEVPGFDGDCVLATYVYGSLDDRKVTVVQNVGRAVHYSRGGEGRYLGMPRPVSVPDFSRMPGLLGLLDRARTAEQEQQAEWKRAAEDAERSRPERERAMRERGAETFRAREAAIARARLSTVPVLVPAAGFGAKYVPAEYWRRSGDVLVSFEPPSTGPVVRAGSAEKPQSGIRSPDADDAFRFTVRKLDGSVITTWTISNAEYQAQQNLSAADRALITDVLTLPIPGNDQESLGSVIRLFDWELAIPGAVSSFFGGRIRHFRRELTDALLPLYRNAVPEKKQAFLQELLQRLTEQKTITAATHTAVKDWFKVNRSRFETNE